MLMKSWHCQFVTIVEQIQLCFIVSPIMPIFVSLAMQSFMQQIALLSGIYVCPSTRFQVLLLECALTTLTPNVMNSAKNAASHCVHTVALSEVTAWGMQRSTAA